MASPKPAPPALLDKGKIQVRRRKLSFTERTIKLVAFRTGNRCAFPGCQERLIEPATPLDEPVILGEIAHIRGENPGAARYDASMTNAERQRNDNLLVLCRRHHRVVDGQEATYPVEVLLAMKADHEHRVERLFEAAVGRVGFQELTTICKALMCEPGATSSDLLVIPPAEKLAANGLTARSGSLLRMGLSKAAEVTNFLDRMSVLDPDFSERLRTGFVDAYHRHVADGLTGDDLFTALVVFAAEEDPALDRQAAGLAVLSHLFEVCDIFERVSA
jgi:hypothetical protein